MNIFISIRTETVSTRPYTLRRRIFSTRMVCSFLRAVLPLCVCMCALSCAHNTIPFFGSHEKVVLTVPEQYRMYGVPTVQNSQDRARLLYIGERGEAHTLILDNGQTEVCFVLPKNRVTPFLFYTRGSDTEPTGCIYPFNTESSRCGGFTAYILYRLFVLSQNDSETVYKHLSRFNWVKLNDLICRRENPWKLDDALITEKIADGTFSARHIKEKRRH